MINCCEESSGPVELYQALGVTQLHIPTIDYLPPSPEDCRRCIDFIRTYSW